MKERLHYMDMAKGVGILCVIVGHLDHSGVRPY